jgi:hypothetical protein
MDRPSVAEGPSFIDHGGGNAGIIVELYDLRDDFDRFTMRNQRFDIDHLPSPSLRFKLMGKWRRSQQENTKKRALIFLPVSYR